jgi:hypothetical protein
MNKLEHLSMTRHFNLSLIFARKVGGKLLAFPANNIQCLQDTNILAYCPFYLLTKKTNTIDGLSMARHFNPSLIFARKAGGKLQYLNLNNMQGWKGINTLAYCPSYLLTKQMNTLDGLSMARHFNPSLIFARKVGGKLLALPANNMQGWKDTNTLAYWPSYLLTKQTNKLDGLSMARHFKPSLIFARKAGGKLQYLNLNNMQVWKGANTPAYCPFYLLTKKTNTLDGLSMARHFNPSLIFARKVGGKLLALPANKSE